MASPGTLGGPKRKRIRICRNGRTRVVILVGTIAIKLPKLNNWLQFLSGLSANCREYSRWEINKSANPPLCPVLFSSWGGFLNVMRRVDRTVYDSEWADLDIKSLNPYTYNDDIPENVGYLDGRLVMIDYG